MRRAAPLSALASYLLSSVCRKKRLAFSPESFCFFVVPALQKPCRLWMGLVGINRQLEALGKVK